ncbi:hypothetical protein, partial [Methanosarcina mazei]
MDATTNTVTATVPVG